MKNEMRTLVSMSTDLLMLIDARFGLLHLHATCRWQRRALKKHCMQSIAVRLRLLARDIDKNSRPINYKLITHLHHPASCI